MNDTSPPVSTDLQVHEITQATVSYTHLDVYKRQVVRCPGAIMDTWRSELWACSSPKNVIAVRNALRLASGSKPSICLMIACVISWTCKSVLTGGEVSFMIAIF